MKEADTAGRGGGGGGGGGKVSRSADPRLHRGKERTFRAKNRKKEEKKKKEKKKGFGMGIS